MKEADINSVIIGRNGKPLTLDVSLLKGLEYHCESTRRKILDTLYQYGRGQSGPSLSIVEILITLYFQEMRWDENSQIWSGW